MTTNNSVNVGLSGATGTGNFVGANTPTLITPHLGTPTDGTLTNCTGYTVANLSDSAWTSWAASIGFTGFSANPTGVTARYKQIGKTCFIYINMTTGTSNATTFTITGLPFTSANTALQTGSVGQAYNNSAITGSPGSWNISPNTTVITMLLGGLSTGWTNTGGKGALFSFFYEIA